MPYPDNMDFAAITEPTFTPEQSAALTVMEESQANWIAYLGAVEESIARFNRKVTKHNIECLMESYEELAWGFTKEDRDSIADYDVGYKPANADQLIAAAVARINA